jgi:hypothetical protein
MVAYMPHAATMADHVGSIVHKIAHFIVCLLLRIVNKGPSVVQ